MEPAETVSGEAHRAPETSGYRKILIAGGQKLDLGKELTPHEVLFARNLESSFELVREQRPDLIMYFTHSRDDRLEEHVMTWLIEGFRGKIVVLDPSNRTMDPEVLMEGQVIDDYVSGPVSLTRFVSLIKSHLSLSGRSSPHSLTTFDLFRNLFERGINAIFFFSEDLERCLAANMAAEQLTGHSLYELRKSGLGSVCGPDFLEETTRVIRRAARHYYDMKGNTAISRKEGGEIESAFSCSWMNFGRSRIVKLEVQTPLWRRRDDPRAINRAALMEAVDESIKGWEKHQGALTVLLFRVHAGDSQGQELGDLAALSAMQKALRSSIRLSDSLVRLSEHQFAVLLPKTETDRAALVLERIRKKILVLPAFEGGDLKLEAQCLRCPPEGLAFLSLLTRGS